MWLSVSGKAWVVRCGCELLRRGFHACGLVWPESVGLRFCMTGSVGKCISVAERLWAIYYGSVAERR